MHVYHLTELNVCICVLNKQTKNRLDLIMLPCTMKTNVDCTLHMMSSEMDLTGSGYASEKSGV